MTEMLNKLDLLDRILAKNLAWISSADTKGTLLFAIDSAMLAVMAALVPPANLWNICSATFGILALIALGTSLIFIVIAAFPRLNGPRNSLIYFGGIASHDENQYVEKIMNGVTEELLSDLARQCHRNAEIAKTKYEMIKRAVIGTFLALPVWLVSVWLMYPLKFPPAHS